VSANRSIAREVNAEASRREVPLSTVIELTYRCNLQCRYCYQRSQDAAEELMNAQWVGILDQLAAMGCLYLTFTGGEPFCREDLLEIVEQAVDRGFAVSVITNGTLVTSAAARRLGELGVTDVGVSLLAARRELHDDLTGVEGSFDRARMAVRELLTAGIRVAIKHTVTGANFGQYRELAAMAEREGALLECDSMVVPDKPGTMSPYALNDHAHALFLRDMGADSIGRYLGGETDFSNLHCDAGRSLCGISPSGEVYPCIQLPVSFGNLRDRPLARLWTGPEACAFRAEELGEAVTCRQCEWRCHCTRCPGMAWAETGAWQGGSPSLCARARAAASAAQNRD
jgi:radical SAM protein with 4Fe4S-binding SPASM domain